MTSNLPPPCNLPLPSCYPTPPPPIPVLTDAEHDLLISSDSIPPTLVPKLAWNRSARVSSAFYSSRKCDKLLDAYLDQVRSNPGKWIPMASLARADGADTTPAPPATAPLYWDSTLMSWLLDSGASALTYVQEKRVVLLGIPGGTGEAVKEGLLQGVLLKGRGGTAGGAEGKTAESNGGEIIDSIAFIYVETQYGELQGGGTTKPHKSTLFPTPPSWLADKLMAGGYMLDPDICTQVLHAGATTLSYMPRGTVRIGVPSGEGEEWRRQAEREICRIFMGEGMENVEEREKYLCFVDEEKFDGVPTFD